MQMKSYGRGKPTVMRIVKKEDYSCKDADTQKSDTLSTNQQKTTSQAATSRTEQSPSEASSYGKWRPENARHLHGCHGLDNHLLQQAKSFLGKADVTVEDARELWQRIDITTRKPK